MKLWFKKHGFWVILAIVLAVTVVVHFYRLNEDNLACQASGYARVVIAQHHGKYCETQNGSLDPFEKATAK